MATQFDAGKYAHVSTTADFYSDFNTNMDIHPGTGDISRVKNEMSVIQSVRNLLLTDYGERPFAPYVGSRLRQMLFEDISPDTAVMMRSAIQNTLNNYEPRVKVIETIVEPNEEEDGYNIRLKFSIINNSEPIEIGFFLDRTR